MTKQRKQKIVSLLQHGSAINKEGVRYYLHAPYPPSVIKLKAEEVAELLDERLLAVINCGCSGFWWAIRPDLIAP